MTNEIEFKIFTKNKGLQITVNRVVYPMLFGCISIAYLADKYFDESILESIGQFGGVLVCILMIYFKIAQSFTRESLNGDLSKNLIFKTSEIIIDDQKLNLNEIKKIEFYIGDYFNNWEYKVKGDLNPARTNGTSNLCELTVQNGKKVRVNFQLKYKDEFQKMKELLIVYYLENKIHFLKLIEYLGIDKYEDIQEFKKTLTPTAP